MSEAADALRQQPRAVVYRLRADITKTVVNLEPDDQRKTGGAGRQWRRRHDAAVHGRHREDRNGRCLREDRGGTIGPFEGAPLDVYFLDLYLLPPPHWSAGRIKIALRISSRALTIRDKRIVIKRRVSAIQRTQTEANARSPD